MILITSLLLDLVNEAVDSLSVFRCLDMDLLLVLCCLHGHTPIRKE